MRFMRLRKADWKTETGVLSMEKLIAERKQFQPSHFKGA